MIIQIQTCDPSTGFELCIFPSETRRKRAAWIMWIAPDGSAQLYSKREESGAVSGKPIELLANVSRAERKAAVPKKPTK